jgi:hypothetical protein
VEGDSQFNDTRLYGEHQSESPSSSSLSNVNATSNTTTTTTTTAAATTTDDGPSSGFAAATDDDSDDDDSSSSPTLPVVVTPEALRDKLSDDFDLEATVVYSGRDDRPRTRGATFFRKMRIMGGWSNLIGTREERDRMIKVLIDDTITRYKGEIVQTSPSTMPLPVKTTTTSKGEKDNEDIVLETVDDDDADDEKRQILDGLSGLIGDMEEVITRLEGDYEERWQLIGDELEDDDSLEGEEDEQLQSSKPSSRLRAAFSRIRRLFEAQRRGKSTTTTTWRRKFGKQLIMLIINYVQGSIAVYALRRAAIERDRGMPKFPLF